jgi:glycine/D-amino acid oxidase-like deaminating enzyme
MTDLERVRSVDTVVIGGGIIGATTLWELARQGEQAILLEGRRFGYESTGKSAAIVRMHYSNPETVRMALRSRQALIDLPGLLGCEPVYYRTGWVFLVDEENAATAARNREMQLREGSASTELGLDELERLVPGIRTDGISYVLHEADSGFADPLETTRAYIRAAVREGARAFENAPVQRIELEQEAVAGVVVDGHRIGCRNIVLAAGAWSKELAAPLGIDLPIEITREQDVIYDTNGTPPVPLAISGQADRIYLRPVPEDGQTRMLVGRGFPKDYELVDPNDYDHDVDADFETEVRNRVVGRIPRFKEMRVVDSRVGLYSVPPDWHPLLGRVDGVDGLVLGTGGSGHSFKLGPAIGEMVAGEVLGRRVEYADIGKFLLSRFESGTAFTSTFGGNRA